MDDDKIINECENINESDGDNMATLAKPYNSIIMIDKDKSQKFLEDSKKNIIKPDFLKQCQKLASMVKHNNK